MTLQKSKFTLLVFLLMISHQHPSMAYIDSVNFEVGDDYSFVITDFSAFIEVNGSTSDIFHTLPVSTNIAVGEKGKIRVDQIKDDVTSESTVVSVTGTIGDQDINGDTYVNGWFNFFNQSLNTVVSEVRNLTRDDFEFRLPESSDYSLVDQKEPSPLFATDDEAFYTLVNDEFPFYFDSLITGIKSTSHILIIDNNDNPNVFTFELSLFLKEGGLDFGGKWQLNGTINCSAEIDIKESRVNSYYILQESVYQYEDAWWKSFVEFGFAKPSSEESRFDFSLTGLLFSSLLLLPFLIIRKRFQFR